MSKDMYFHSHSWEGKKFFVLPLYLFPWDIMVFTEKKIFDDLEKILSKFDIKVTKEYKDQIEKCRKLPCRGMVWSLGTHLFLYLKKKPKDPETIGVLAHEAVHLAKKVFENAGEENDNEEFMAYITEYITIQTIRMYN